MSEAPPRNTAKWAKVLGMLCILLLCAVAYSLLDVWRAERAASWPTANGKITDSRSAPGCGRSGNGYHVFVRYSYRVGGIEYQSHRILFGASSCYSRQEAQASMAQFPAAAVVKVSFDPQAPAESVLVAGRVDESTWTGVYFISFWFLIAAMATGMAVIVARSERRPASGLPPQRELGKRD